jgi:hypothetical protein
VKWATENSVRGEIGKNIYVGDVIAVMEDAISSEYESVCMITIPYYSAMYPTA